MTTIQSLSTTMLLVTFCLFTNSAAAQQNVLKVKPMSFEFAYERALNDMISIQVAARFLPIGVSADGPDDGNFKYTNYRLTPEVRFYLAKSGNLTGFFVAPHLKLGFNTMKTETVSDTDLRSTAKFNGTSLGSGLTLGWQWVMGKGFTIDTQFGWGYTRMRFNDVKVTYSDGRTETEQVDLDGLNFILPRVGFSIGYAF